MSCPETRKCNFIIKNTNFTENIATFNGGAISWDDRIPELSNNCYKNNIAEYGQSIASFPVKLMQVKEDGSLIDYKRRNLDIPISFLNATEVASGQTIKVPLLIALVDNLNNIVRTDNSSEASLRAVNSSTQISGTTKVTALRGIFNFSKFTISEEPGFSIQIMVNSPAIAIDKIKKSGESFYSENLALDIKMRECEIGEVKSGKNCEVCPAEFYSLNPNLISCLACPDNVVCYGNYTMVPKPGYWRDNMYTDKFWKCPHAEACLGSPDIINISYTGQCGIAYKGNKCQSCKVGYSHTSSNKCEECPATKENILILLGITLFLIILLSIMVNITRKSAFKSKSHVSIYIKIFLNYIKTVILASSFKLNWSSEVVEFFSIQNNADYVYQQIYSFQCLFKYEDSTSLIYFRTLTMIASIPFLMLLLSFLFWYTIKLAKSSYQTFRDDFISTCIILLFLIHPSIVKKMFASMNCTEINSGEYWLEEDLDIKCWNYEHIFYMLTFSLPTIILWGIILPTICLVNIIRNRKKLDNINVRLTYGFLFNGFKTEHFYWEFIILYSKIILICFSVFLTKISLKLQALIVAIIYSIYLRLQYSNNPYTEHKLNQMKLRSKLVCVVTIYSGLYYLMGSLSSGASIFFYVIIIIIANLYFLIYWAFYLLKLILTAVKKKFSSWRNKNKVRSEIEGEDPDRKYADSQNLQNINSSIASNENLLIENQALNSDKDASYQEIAREAENNEK
ncbi:unnamed protein product [Blepharisma stoltei]|uniref:Uncharacterized protein n=1 Tax=Blepharisma stoltei TaxID=1481888 RepID=A0AAU9IK88_9CILI|nr:unnamed protein product [Blepharisma stoltei]